MGFVWRLVSSREGKGAQAEAVHILTRSLISVVLDRRRVVCQIPESRRR
jgi:hypothetical protein